MDNQIRVDMTPNPLDIQTIHCSQGDTEAREWGFELHNNGELIDTSEITEQLFFKAYKGGTEQILPENTSTPTTSPFKGDIRYPQGLLSDQEFLYRESPTEEDGYAKIETIYGNTLVWNQLFNPSSFSYGTLSGITTSASGTGGIHIEGTATATAILAITSLTTIANHKYLLLVSKTAINGLTVLDNSSPRQFDGVATNVIFTSSGANINAKLRVTNGTSINATVYPMLFDLTQMGLDNITSVDEFTSLFSLPYYDYNAGSLLSFMGNGIKTVGFNQWDEEWEVGAYNSADGTKADNVRDRIRNKNPIRVFPSVNYYKNKGLKVYYVYYYDASMNFIGWNSLANQGIFTPPSNACYMNFNGLANTGTTYNNDICINISDANKNGTYEPYTSSTLSLPISTYFPNGMKSAGSVYDELTESKAITRIGAVDLGTLSWMYSTSLTFPVMESNSIADAKEPSTNSKLINCISVLAPTLSAYQVGEVGNGISIRTGGRVRINIPDMGTDANAFKTAMSGVMLYYELATPTETLITTASLVTENAEIPLSNEDGVLIGKCTEQLSSESGFIDAKIKLADEDGECYSNKLQLHVERSPQ